MVLLASSLLLALLCVVITIAVTLATKKVSISWFFGGGNVWNSGAQKSVVEKIEGKCSKPSCVRCRNTTFSREFLIARLGEYKSKRSHCLDTKRIELSLSDDVMDVSSEGNSGLLSEAGPEGPSVDKDTKNKQSPTVFFMKGLAARAWHPVYPPLQNDIDNLLGKEVLRLVGEELDFVMSSDRGWTVNKSDQGCWRLFYLYNQGSLVPENCAICPETFDVINKLDNFMTNIVFGNACFSVLSPGTQIERHSGPTNCRLRCQVLLRGDPGCVIEVAGQKRKWVENDVLLFDDSYPHSVSHAGIKPRCILILDLWHPDVTEEERDCLSYMF